MKLQRSHGFPVLVIILILSVSSINAFAEKFVFETNTIRYVINSDGLNVSLQEKGSGKDYIAAPPSPFAHVTKTGKTYPVTRLTKEGECFLATFGNSGITACYRIIALKTHITIELKSLSGGSPDNIQLCNIKTIPFSNSGRIIAAQWNDEITVCLMALSERVNSQIKGNDTVTSTVYPEFGMIGEKTALIAVPTSEFLDVVQEVEKTYHLPSPTINGKWAKQSPDVDTNYLFIDVSEQTADQVIAYAKLGGFKYVLIPWSSWASSRGSYPINRINFPQGEESLKKTIDKFHATGIKVGMHMLTSLISKNDPLVRPKPDARLLKDAATTLAEDIDARTTTINASGSLSAFMDGVRQHDDGADRGIDIQIDDEIIYCRQINDADNVFSDCRRGAYGTVKNSHKTGAPVHRLAQGAGSYMADLKTSLKDEIADRIASVVNICGFDMIYFDGTEQDRANGPFWYYVGQQQTAIAKRIKRDMLYQGSAMSHWLWHIFSRKTCADHAAIAVKNYMDHYKLHVMKHYRANFMPAELGWCGLLAGGLDHPATTVEDIEHYGTRMIAYGVPISIQTKLAALERNPQSADLLQRLKQIHELRLSGKLAASQREQMKNGYWSLFDDAGGVAIKPLEPEKIHSPIEYTQANSAADNARVLFQGSIGLTADPSEEQPPLPGTLICSIYCRDQKATEKDCRWPLQGESPDLPSTPQDIGGRQALAATIVVSGSQTNMSAPYPVLNIQLEDERGWYRDYFFDLDFEGEKTFLLPRTNIQRLLLEFSRPDYKLRRAFRYFDYRKVAAVNLRWMRMPANKDMIVSIKNIWAVSAPEDMGTATQHDQ